MCGICCLFNKSEVEPSSEIWRALYSIKHRGPDWTGLHSHRVKDGVIGNIRGVEMGHNRLAIVGVESGKQPIQAQDLWLCVNGEIYNHKELRDSHNLPGQATTDCEVIILLCQKYGINHPEMWVNELRGMYSFILYDEKKNSYLACRDPIGIIPLYYSSDKNCDYYCSEVKAVLGFKTGNMKLLDFPPGCYTQNGHSFIKYVDALPVPEKIAGGQLDLLPMYKDVLSPSLISMDIARNAIRQSLEKSIKSHLMADVPFGILLSGGLDSSIVAAVATKFAKENTSYPQIHTFSIGLVGSPDLEYADVVAKYLGTTHHKFTFTLEEAEAALSSVIYSLETYDITTIRASTPMYLMSEKIKAMGFKMVLSGEGADEIFGGYLYFRSAPNVKEFHNETKLKMERLHKYDCLRANKSTMAYGLEARVPFLDTDFIRLAMNIPTKYKMINSGEKYGGKNIEKRILREAFEDYLPKEIAWRQKEQFSDGVGYSWIDHLKAISDSRVSDEELQNASSKYGVNTPTNKEGYYYRSIYIKHYPLNWMAELTLGGPTIACSTEKAVEWDESFKGKNDPSGRICDTHDKHL